MTDATASRLGCLIMALSALATIAAWAVFMWWLLGGAA